MLGKIKINRDEQRLHTFLPVIYIIVYILLYLIHFRKDWNDKWLNSDLQLKKRHKRMIQLTKTYKRLQTTTND